MHLVKNPSFLVLHMNGDTFHAGLAWRDANTAFRCAAQTIKYHVHFVKEGNSLSDGIQFLSDFKTRFMKPPSTKRDDFDAIMDAVCSESPAVEEASNYAPAVPRWSGKPEPGSPAALLQQVDRGIRANRPACSSWKT